MNRSQILTAFSLRRRNRPTLAEIEILLDLLPEATLLLDVHEDLILLSNARATELTAFTRAELARLNPESIFPGVGAKGLIRNLDKNESSFATLIRTHNGSEITVDIELTPLDQEEKWILVVLIPSAHRQRQADDNRRREEQFLNMLVLCQSLQEPNIEKGIHKALEAGHKLTGGDVLVAYLVNPAVPGLTRAIHV
ncbi:MAG: hypothetical protein ACNA8H_07210, partial [Anaerolineales bacterium]